MIAVGTIVAGVSENNSLPDADWADYFWISTSSNIETR
jgi:hypothetical protein